MQITKNELHYYLVIGFGAIVFEIINSNGAGLCVFPPFLLLMGWAILNFIPENEKASD